MMLSALAYVWLSQTARSRKTSTYKDVGTYLRDTGDERLRDMKLKEKETYAVVISVTLSLSGLFLPSPRK